ncbi:pirin [Pedobacter lusitanus]|uniref:Pirin n=1 Tax=Pedobacter lusitanus TaxID=1503925 RepID=A0A0D0GK76_9SPHI|nr:pirin family protein [Pedobacter lusitanus]KIO76580.1 pirin [Pedobacter lusitanus]
MRKKIAHILLGREKQITKDETVLQPLPHKDFRFANPFIVLHHMGPENIVPGQELRIHPHPHRGFSPVTFQLQGEGYHKDNAGNDEIIKAGDVQWMFAGKGILHSEGPTKELLKNGGTQELIQLWVNVPQAHKWDEPCYQSATKTMQPEVLKQEGVHLRLVSGEYEEQTGPMKSFTPVTTIIGEIQQGKRVDIRAVPGYWTLIYVISGSVNINDEPVSFHHLAVLEKDNDQVILDAAEDSKILFLSALPIEEPLAAKDNFVMNTEEETNQAIAEYKNGAFGTLEF